MIAEYYGISNLKHDRQLAAALGDMLVAWAAAENALLVAMAYVLSANLHQMQVGYYRVPTFEARTKLLRALIIEWKAKGSEKDRMSHVISKLSKLSTVRNGWVHGDWAVDKARKKTVIFDFRETASSPKRNRPGKAADVTNHIKAVRNWTMELEALTAPWLETFLEASGGRDYPLPRPGSSPSE
jgi:hypothetical protein